MSDLQVPYSTLPVDKSDDSEVTHLLYESILSVELIVSAICLIFFISINASSIIIILSLATLLSLCLGAILSHFARTRINPRKQSLAVIFFCFAALLCTSTSLVSLKTFKVIELSDIMEKLYSSESSGSGPNYSYSNSNGGNSYSNPYGGGSFNYGNSYYTNVIPGYGYTETYTHGSSFYNSYQYSTNTVYGWLPYYPYNYVGTLYTQSTRDNSDDYTDITYDYDNGYTYSIHSTSYHNDYSDSADTTYIYPYGMQPTHSRSSGSFSGQNSWSYGCYSPYCNPYDPYNTYSTSNSYASSNSGSNGFVLAQGASLMASSSKIFLLVALPIQIFLFAVLICQASKIKQSLKDKKQLELENALIHSQDCLTEAV